MGLFSRRPSTPAERELEAARDSLSSYRSPTRREDDEYHRRNDRVIDAERALRQERRRSR